MAKNQHALHALTTLRSEIAGRIRQNDEANEGLRDELRCLDVVIRIVSDDEVDPEAIRDRQRFPRKDDLFRHGEKTELITAALREVPEGDAVLTSVIVEYALRKKGFDPQIDRKTRRIYYTKFQVQLRALWVSGRVEKVGQGYGVKWRLPSGAIEPSETQPSGS